MTIVLGVDPGSRKTGYGVVRSSGNSLICADYGVINVEKQPISDRLCEIYAGIRAVLHAHQVEEFAIEQAFVGNNAQSALKLGQARGAAMVAAGRQNLQCFEYAPLEIKKAITGTASAAKEQIQYMVKMLLNLDTNPPQDAADALAVAITHLHVRDFRRLEKRHRDALHRR